MPIPRSIHPLILLLLIFNSGWSGAQTDQLTKLVIKPDTSEYVPYIYSDALEYNLMIAASKGYASEIKRLIRNGADVNKATPEGVTPLIFAVANNKPEAVDVILTYQPDIDGVTSNNETALLIAVKAGYFAITEKLIRAGANIYFTDHHGATALHYAASYGYPDIADLLMYYDAEIDSRALDGNTPLLVSVWTGYIEITDLLIQQGADVNEKNLEGFTPYLLAAYFGDTITMKMLELKNADIYARTNNGLNALALAIISEQKDAITYLLGRGKDWNSETRGIDPYKIASKYGRKEMIPILQENKVAGRIGYAVDQVSFVPTARVSLRDIYTGMAISFKEPFLNFGFTAGLDTKIWRTRVYIKESDNVVYQFWDRSSLAYAGFFKDFLIRESSENSQIFFSASATAGYSFGDNMKGTYRHIDPGLKLIPAASFRWSRMNLTVNAGVEYVKTEFYRHGPLWFRIGIGYNYFLDNMRIRIKPPRWF